ncbi:DegV family protein [Mycoplasma sp. 246B]
MKRLGIIVDSFSGLSVAQADELGYKFLPLQVEIDGESFEDGYVSNLEILKKISVTSKIKTSLPKIDKMTRIIQDAAKNYDDVIYLGISQHLSNTFMQARSISMELSNVHIMENHLFGNQIVRTVAHLKKMYENGASINQLFETLNNINETSRTFIVPYRLEYLINGGRLSGIKKFLLSKLKVYPVLSYNEEGKVKSVATKWNFKNATAKAFDLVNEFIDSLKNIDKNAKYYVDLISGVNDEVNQAITSDQFIKASTQITTPLPIAAHTGPEAFAVSVMVELEKNE